jgi:hypothetical protein
MAVQYLQGIADRGQVYGLVPLQEQSHILLNLKHLLFIDAKAKLRKRAMNRIG